MHSLTAIRTINAQAAAAPRNVEDNSNRHCSFHASEKGVVLHSARQRSTGFIDKGKAKHFLVEIQSTNSQVKKDAIIESYFSSQRRVNVVSR